MPSFSKGFVGFMVYCVFRYFAVRVYVRVSFCYFGFRFFKVFSCFVVRVATVFYRWVGLRVLRILNVFCG